MTGTTITARMADTRGAMEHRIAAVLVAAVAALARLIRVVLRAGKIVLESLLQGLLDIFMQVLLVVLDGQH